MSTLLVGLGVVGGLLAWILFRYFAAQKRREIDAAARRVKENNYQRVLEKAKHAEHEEKIFKAQTGHILSQLSLAKEYELTNIHEALKWYYKAAIQDNIIAQNALARLYRMDNEDPDGNAKSAYWSMVVQAKQQEPAAQFELGRYQIRGYGSEVDIESGVANVLAAAEVGYLPAQLFLGDWYVSENVQCKEPQEAFHWRINAALHNDPQACINTAYCYQAGMGITKNKLCSVYWLERAAELDNAKAQQLAAKMHIGSDANNAAVAYIWYSLAYVNGSQSAKEERNKLAQAIGIDEILAVQNVANTVFKMIKHEAYQPHKVITVLDRVYGRKGYRPTEEMLAGLASRDGRDDTVTDGDLQAEVIAETSDDLNDNKGTERNETSPLNVTAAKEYSDQNWQASWSSFMSETDKP
ncbi:tetratricopeptide repeat protein [Photobacterium nomapromontoriensis]|uniref:tetratricopeptide repeat protein n=1 Tax=Photobacterium nomapromontoriensis TaxID=2910237 RepID=UPI003D11A1B3